MSDGDYAAMIEEIRALLKHIKELELALARAKDEAVVAQGNADASDAENERLRRELETARSGVGRCEWCPHCHATQAAREGRE